MFRPTYMPNLVSLAWKMSSGMSKEVGLLNDPSCAYSMRQNLHDGTCPISEGNKCPCQVWKWHVKNYGRESVNEACVPCLPPGRRQYPGALKGCRVTKVALNAEIPSATKISIWHNMVVLWNSHTVKQSRWWFCLIEIKHYNSRGPITLWLCVLHVHWCRDCETVHEQHWNKQRTVSQSQCTPPQCKQIRFGIKNESEVHGQSSPELIGIFTVLICICGPDLEILTWIGLE